MKLRYMTSIAALCIGLAGSASAQVMNGGFETGDFTGWTQFGNTGFTGVSGTFSGVPAPEGSFQAYFGPVNSHGGIMQTISGNAGDVYTVSFMLHNFGGSPTFFEASLDGQPILSLANSAVMSYTLYTGTVTSTSANPVLKFETQQNPSYWLLDNVRVSSVTGVPEPGTVALLVGMGLGSLSLLRRRRSRG